MYRSSNLEMFAYFLQIRNGQNCSSFPKTKSCTLVIKNTGNKTTIDEVSELRYAAQKLLRLSSTGINHGLYSCIPSSAEAFPARTSKYCLKKWGRGCNSAARLGKMLVEFLTAL
ncbi:hypothetical protein ACFX15_040324 [Malus domestica]